jgi:hypothetical protein
VSEAGSLAFHVASPDNAEARVVLLERGADAGRLRAIEWQAGAYHLPGRADEVSAEEMSARVDQWRRAGWRFSEPPPRILAWLESASV